MVSSKIFNDDTKYSVLRVHPLKYILTKYHENNLVSEKSGDNSEEVTPVPISNTVVKLLSADDTWRAAAWESRTSPVLEKKEVTKVASFFHAEKEVL